MVLRVPSTLTRRFASRFRPCRNTYARCTTVSTSCSANRAGNGSDTSCRTNDTLLPRSRFGSLTSSATILPTSSRCDELTNQHRPDVSRCPCHADAA